MSVPLHVKLLGLALILSTLYLARPTLKQESEVPDVPIPREVID